ncbi:MAG: small multi-drug export protein [Mobilicoccus sp.]|nr:small multi-drug export protein [Mobilicoccus sp.]
MTNETFWGLLGVFAGGAFPWLEAIIVIPAGMLAGLPTVPVVIAGATGNVLTVVLAAYAGDWFATRWAAVVHRRRRRKDDPDQRARKGARDARRRQRVQHVLDRGGLPLLSFLSPFIGTQICAAAAVALGARPGAAAAWISLMTVLWCVVAAWATHAGFQFFT